MTSKYAKSLLFRCLGLALVATLMAGCLETDTPYMPSDPVDDVDVSENDRQVIIRDVQTGQPVLIFHFEQTRTETNGLTSDVQTTLFVQNVSNRALTFTYQIDVYSDLGYYQWNNAGYVQNLQPGTGVDQGTVSTNQMHLKFAVFQIFAE